MMEKILNRDTILQVYIKNGVRLSPCFKVLIWSVRKLSRIFLSYFIYSVSKYPFQGRDEKS